MDKIMEKFNKLSLPAVILIASIILGSFYYASQVSKQRSIERQQQTKIDQEKRDQLYKELKEKEIKEQVEQALNACITSAEENYSANWRKTCKAQGELSNRCIALNEMTFEEYKKQNPRKSEEGLDTRVFDFYKERDKCSCSLPLDIADRKNKSLRDEKDECLKRYPQK